MCPKTQKKEISFGFAQGFGSLALRGDGVMICYELRGPSPESSTLADVASASRQLAAAFMHLGTGDMVHVVG